jgi:hypothetical protein
MFAPLFDCCRTDNIVGCEEFQARGYAHADGTGTSHTIRQAGVRAASPARAIGWAGFSQPAPDTLSRTLSNAAI